MHPVISFSVINYVVSMRHPRESDEVSFSFYIPLASLTDASDLGVICQPISGNDTVHHVQKFEYRFIVFGVVLV